MPLISTPDNALKINAAWVLTAFFVLGGLILSLGLALVLGVDSKAIKRYFGLAQKHPTSCLESNVIYPSWPGEYPYPAVSVSEHITLNGSHTLCDLETKSPCTLSPGVYHPWSTIAATYASIIAQPKFLTLEPIRGKKKRHDSGSELLVLEYKSTSSCIVSINTDSWEMSCPSPLSDNWLQPKNADDNSPQQFIKASCKEGEKLWVEVNDDLFQNAQIDRSEIGMHGMVGTEMKSNHD